MMRMGFDRQLERLNRELTDMGMLCEQAIGLLTQALRAGTQADAGQIKELEIRIDQAEWEIETLCLKLLLQQQPVARDLRTVSSAMKMISDMERIGDQAVDIAEILQYVTDTEAENKAHLIEMAEAACSMVTYAVAAFVEKDLVQARTVIAYDDRVDSLFLAARRELTGLIGENPENGEKYLDLLMIAKYFERIGDHAVNLAEWVEFSVTGRHTEENTDAETNRSHS